jgi:hypothetical protein
MNDSRERNQESLMQFGGGVCILLAGIILVLAVLAFSSWLMS